VEDGLARCRQCTAPQIRVVTEASNKLAPPSETAAYSFVAAPALPGAIHWSRAFPAVVWGALLAAVSMIAPLGMLGLGLLMGGALAVASYRRRVPGAMTRGMGAKLGALAGALGFAVYIVLIAAQVATFRMGGQIRQALLDAVDKAAARSADPQAAAAAAQLKSPEGLAFMMGAFLVIMLLLFLIGASLGGALGVSLLRKRR
jgi:hypothetical protein